MLHFQYGFLSPILDSSTFFFSCTRIWQVGGCPHLCPLKQPDLLWAEPTDTGKAEIVQLWSSLPPELTPFSPFHHGSERHRVFFIPHRWHQCQNLHCQEKRIQPYLFNGKGVEWYYDWPLFSTLRCSERSMLAKTVQKLELLFCGKSQDSKIKWGNCHGTTSSKHCLKTWKVVFFYLGIFPKHYLLAICTLQFTCFFNEKFF